MGINTDIWDAIRHGDTAAMKKLYQEYYADLYAFGFSLIADEDKTKDALHELFCELWQNRSSLSDVQHIKAYLKTCLKHKISRELSMNKQVSSMENNVALQDLREHSYEELLIATQTENDEKIRLWQAIHKLTPTQREIIDYKFFKGLNYEAIALLLGLKPRTVYNHVYTALCILRSSLK